MRALLVALVPIALMACGRGSADAGPTVCALGSGAIDLTPETDAGPFEVCTPEYPVCTGPYPESPGYQCCNSQPGGGGGGATLVTCMPNDAAAYQR